MPQHPVPEVRVQSGFGVGAGAGYMGTCSSLAPKVCKDNSPKPILTAIKAIVLHTFGV